LLAHGIKLSVERQKRRAGTATAMRETFNYGRWCLFQVAAGRLGNAKIGARLHYVSAVV
jgi:hypothetical protein